ncbi:MAG: M48 family metalloprotease [Rhizobacter sp.]
MLRFLMPSKALSASNVSSPSPEAGYFRKQQGFALPTRCIFLGLVLAYLVMLLLALVGVISGVAEIIAPVPQDDVFTWIGLLLGSYILFTGLYALRPRPLPMSDQFLTRERVPKLFHLLDKVAEKVGVSLPPEVRLGTEMQVQTIGHPRLGLLGCHRHSLVLGLPLLLTLDVKQLASVLAHELAHLGPSHGPLGTWARFMRITWARLADEWQVSSQKLTPWQLLRLGPAVLLLRYAFPRLNERALVLSRQEAFAADKLARRVAGSQATVDALVRLKVQGEYLRHGFWPEVLGRASHSPTPNVLPYRAMIQRLSGSKSHPKASTWLKQVLLQNTASHDACPCLRERLARTKLSPGMPMAPKHSAAKLLMGDALDQLVVDMDVFWQRNMTVAWAELHRDYLAQHHLERELQAEGERGALHPDDHLLWARAARKTQGDVASEALLRLMLIDHEDDINARFELGCLLIDQLDADAAAHGAQLLRTLGLTSDHPRALDASIRYGQWLSLHPAHEDAGFWPDEILRNEHRAEQAHAAVLKFEDEHSLLAPDISPRCLRLVRKLLLDGGTVRQAHWVSKRVVAFPDWRYAVVVLSLVPGHRLGDLPARLEALLQSMSLPIALAVVDASDPAWLSGEKRATLDRLQQVPGAALFSLESDEVHSSSTPSRYMPA